MRSTSLDRRRWLGAALACALPGIAPAAPSAYAADGPARRRSLAVHALANDIVAAGERLVAVGERGHVLLSDDQGAEWRQALSVPTRTTLTAVHATDARTLWAVGHGGVVLKSADAGERWELAAGDALASEVLLSVRVEPDGRGLAVGGFGHALATTDGGAHWQRVELLQGEDGERHLNRIFVTAAGTWLIAAEGGLVMQSDDRGAHWRAIRTPYNGSLWSGTSLPGGAIVACGMRGNIVRSHDEGRNWTRIAMAGAGSLVAAAALPDGRCVLAGVDGTLVVGTAGGERFELRMQDDRSTLTGLAVLPSGRIVACGAQGMRRLPVLS